LQHATGLGSDPTGTVPRLVTGRIARTADDRLLAVLLAVTGFIAVAAHCLGTKRSSVSNLATLSADLEPSLVWTVLGHVPYFLTDTTCPSALLRSGIDDFANSNLIFQALDDKNTRLVLAIFVTEIDALRKVNNRVVSHIEAASIIWRLRRVYVLLSLLLAG